MHALLKANPNVRAGDMSKGTDFAVLHKNMRGKPILGHGPVTYTTGPYNWPKHDYEDKRLSVVDQERDHDGGKYHPIVPGKTYLESLDHTLGRHIKSSKGVEYLGKVDPSREDRAGELVRRVLPQSKTIRVVLTTLDAAVQQTAALVHPNHPDQNLRGGHEGFLREVAERMKPHENFPRPYQAISRMDEKPIEKQASQGEPRKPVISENGVEVYAPK